MRSLRNMALMMAILTGSGPVLAAGPKTLGEYGPWRAYAYSDGGGKVCYASASAAQTVGGVKERKPTYLLVTDRSSGKGEVSLNGAWGFKKDSDAEVQVGAMKHTFFSKGDSAWTKQQGADKALIAAMMKSKAVVVHATPQKGTAIIDSIPLEGFSKALAAIDKECGIKRP